MKMVAKPSRRNLIEKGVDMNHKVIDNFLDEEYFDSLVNLFTDKERPGHIDQNHDIPWYFTSKIVDEGDEIGKSFYMTHMFYNGHIPFSPLYNELIPLLEKLEVKCLLRIKANLYPNTHTLHEHSMHSDYDFSHSAAILSLNTCDGYTKLRDGTKIDSIANRILLFDASEKHCSTTTTNVPARINININYIHEQFHE